MAFLTESDLYESGIYQLETTDPVQGGSSGVSNLPLKHLANRTKWLKARMDAAGMSGSSPSFSLNMDNLQTPGTHFILATATNRPATGEGICFVGAFTGVGGPKISQVYMSLVDGQVYSRQINVATVGLWQRLVRSSEIDGIIKTTGVVVSFSGAWQALSGFAPAAHKQLKRVWLSGRVEEGTTNGVVLNIPAGFRPVREFHGTFFNRDTLENETVIIGTDGDLEIYSETTAVVYNGALYFPLDWISYEVA